MINITHRGAKLSFESYVQAWAYMDKLRKGIVGSRFSNQSLINSEGRTIATIHCDRRYPAIVRPPLKPRPGNK